MREGWRERFIGRTEGRNILLWSRRPKWKEQNLESKDVVECPTCHLPAVGLWESWITCPHITSLISKADLSSSGDLELQMTITSLGLLYFYCSTCCIALGNCIALYKHKSDNKNRRNGAGSLSSLIPALCLYARTTPNYLKGYYEKIHSLWFWKIFLIITIH